MRKYSKRNGRKQTNETEQNRTKQANKIRENTYEWLKWELKYYIKKTLKLCWRTEKEGLMI